MKKVLVLCLTLALVMVFGITSVAAPNGFINSPTGESGPELISGENDGDGCNGDVILTPYSELDKLDEEEKGLMDEAYNSIISVEDLVELSSDLKTLAQQLGIDSSELAVSDLFYLDCDCDNHENHGIYKVTIKPETLKNYAGVMYFDGEKWVSIKDAVLKDGQLSFNLNNPAPVAVVVNSGSSNVNAPQTGDSFPWIYVGIIAVSAIALAVVLIRLKKREA